MTLRKKKTAKLEAMQETLLSFALSQLTEKDQEYVVARGAKLAIADNLYLHLKEITLSRKTPD